MISWVIMVTYRCSRALKSLDVLCLETVHVPGPFSAQLTGFSVGCFSSWAHFVWTVFQGGCPNLVSGVGLFHKWSIHCLTKRFSFQRFFLEFMRESLLPFSQYEFIWISFHTFLANEFHIGVVTVCNLPQRSMDLHGAGLVTTMARVLYQKKPCELQG